jgi:hypothetical protein
MNTQLRQVIFNAAASTQRDLKRFALAASALVLAVLTGCASTTPQPVPRVTQIRVLPVMPIDRLYTENNGVPLGVIWQGVADRIKSNDFNQRMDATRLALAPRFTEALLKELRSQGFDASLMEGVNRPAAAPDDIDYARLPGVAPVLHVYFSELGMFSARFALDYVPRVNVGAALVVSGRKDAIYEESVYYGADSRGIQSWSVPADPRFKWSSFSALVEKPEAVVESYDVAVTALARQIAVNIKA